MAGQPRANSDAGRPRANPNAGRPRANSNAGQPKADSSVLRLSVPDGSTRTASRMPLDPMLIRAPGGMASHRANARRTLLALDRWRAMSWTLGLSMREMQIARQLAAGASEKQVAARLGLSPRTVHTYLERLYAKLGVQSRCMFLMCLFVELLALSARAGGRMPPARSVLRAALSAKRLTVKNRR